MSKRIKILTITVWLLIGVWFSLTKLNEYRMNNYLNQVKEERKVNVINISDYGICGKTAVYFDFETWNMERVNMGF